MNYTETLAFLYDTLPMFSRMGSAAIKKDLTNIRLLCDRLGHPEQRFRTIHVGGTNGKGSVSHMLAAVLQTAGYKTGLYTSPHMYDFRERIRLDGKMVEEDFIVRFVEKVQPYIREIEPSFFEITVAMAFEYFAEKNVDLAVIEVGLGGRLDSTNIVQPELSVITNIGWDHMNLLGNTLQEIAHEKAGIIKPFTPAVIGEKLSITQPVFEQVAKAQTAPLYFAEDYFQLLDAHWDNDLLKVEIVQQGTGAKHFYNLDLNGIYQSKNIITVLTAVDRLRSKGIALPEPAMKHALQNVKQLTGLQGRWEIISRNPMVVLEVAHNKEGILQMNRHINKVGHKRLHLVMGLVKDKDPDLVLPQLPADAMYYFTQAQIPRALPAAALRDHAGRFGLQGAVFPDVNAAVSAAMQHAGPDDLIVVCGSIFVVAEVDRTLSGVSVPKEMKNEPDVIR